MPHTRRSLGNSRAKFTVRPIICALLIAGMALSVNALAGKGDGGGSGASGGSTAGPGPIQVPATAQDYFQKGTQPLGAGLPGPIAPFPEPQSCASCHGSYGNQDPFLIAEPHAPWVASMMGQSGRDPLFFAGMTIANQDAAGAGEYCMRCHVPQGWISGHAVPTDGSALTLEDRNGVHCNFCHRMVDPEYKPGISPVEDQQILTDLANAGLLTPQGNNARYTIDPIDTRRGPYNDVPQNLHTGDPQPALIHSPFHTKSDFCWTCHGVSNPLMVKQGSDYSLGSIDSSHPTGLQTDMFPLHRTFEEWKNSYYSNVGVQHDGRFGGNHPTGIMKDCQDCHMPDQQAYGCNFQFPPFFERPNIPQHSFIGPNTWVVGAIRTVDADNNGQPDFPDSDTGLNDDNVAAAFARSVDFLEKASDMFLAQVSQSLRVRLQNMTGHKLPTGFPDGRRIWINVKFYDCNEEQIHEHGAYDFGTATLSESDTKVYECKLGIDGVDYAQSLGRPEGHTFHFVLANKIIKDNRIPPPGHSATLAVQNQTAPVGATYPSGQHWDDTLYPIPTAAKKAVVTVYYQLTSREFIEHLRDDNVTDNRGQVAYDLWVNHGMSLPVVMDIAEIPLFHPPDCNQDGVVNIDDLVMVITAWGSCPNPPFPCPADVNKDGFINIDDLVAVITAWGPC